MRNPTVLWLTIALALGVGLSALSGRPPVLPVESTVASVFSPFQDGLRRLFSPFTDFLSDLGNYQELRDQNQNLREENERLSAEIVGLREALQREREAADLAEVQRQREEFQLTLADVIATDPNNQRQLIAIDQGSDDGIEPGMVVIASGGSLVGRVTKVLPGYSWVTLISDPHSGVNAEIQVSGARGVVSGQPDFTLQMELVPEGSPVQIGDTVITSGLGGNFPKALYVGLVSAVQGNPQDLFLTVTVEAAVRLNRLNTVLVIQNFVPLTFQEP